MARSEKVNGAELFGRMESGNVGAIYTKEKDRVRNRRDNGFYNHMMNIIERECNFRFGGEIVKCLAVAFFCWFIFGFC
jgi:hypothetical protein